MKKNFIFSLILVPHLFLSNLFCGDAPIGKNFPKIELESLAGAPIALPENKPTLFVFCFEKECANQVRDWVHAIRAEKLLPDSVNLYIIPVLGNSFKARLFKPLIISSIKKRIPKKEHEKIALFVKDGGAMKKFLQYEEKKKDHVYLVLIDKKGIVRWQHAGTLTSATRNELKKIAAKIDVPFEFE